MRHLKLQTDVSLVFDSAHHALATLNTGPLQCEKRSNALSPFQSLF